MVVLLPIFALLGTMILFSKTITAALIIADKRNQQGEENKGQNREQYQQPVINCNRSLLTVKPSRSEPK
jgi:hypothetical protein